MHTKPVPLSTLLRGLKERFEAGDEAILSELTTIILDYRKRLVDKMISEKIHKHNKSFYKMGSKFNSDNIS